MAHPLVEAHRDTFLSRTEVPRLPAFFTLSRDFEERSIGIPAQIRLAAKWVLRATEIGLIGPGRPLLIVGAGAAGVTAALTALRHGVPVHLRETKGAPFSMQSNCTTRWLHPHQYEWPAEGFELDRFPRNGEPYSAWMLRWAAATADRVAVQWAKQLDEVVQRYGADWIWFNAPGLPYIGPDNAPVEECNDWKGKPVDFAAYLFCRGFPKEEVTIGSYAGYSFWEDDPFEEPGLGLNSGVHPTVLMSGAGDGGLQDWLRIVFGKVRPSDLIQRVEAVIQTSREAKRQWLAFKQKVLEVATVAGGHRLPRDGDALCGDFVAMLAPDLLIKLFKELKEDLIFDFSRGSLRLLCVRAEMPSAFPINRLLVRLARRIIEENFQIADLLISFGSYIREIRRKASPHECRLNATECHGKEHVALIGDSETVFNVCVVRHGLGDEERPLERKAK